MCSWIVGFVLPRDHGERFHFLPLQDPEALSFFERRRFKTEKDSIVLFDNGSFFQESEAVLKILQDLGFPWSLFRVLNLMPEDFLRRVYAFVARHRYRVLGRQASCTLAPHRYVKRFSLPGDIDTN